MAKKRESTKKLRAELHADRARRGKELAAEFDRERDRLQELPPEYRFRLGDPKLRTLHIEKGLEEWDAQRPPIVSGTYQDLIEVKSIYQRQFFDYSRKARPGMIEELRILVPHFDKAFGWGGYTAIFQWHRMSELVEVDKGLRHHLESELESLHGEIFHNIKPPRIKLRPNSGRKPRYDFDWGRFRMLLQVLELASRFARVPGDESALKDAAGLIRETLAIKSVEATRHMDEGSREILIEGAALRLASRSPRNSDTTSAFAHANSRIKSLFLDASAPDGAAGEVDAFVHLQLTLLEWAERHRIEKDWALRYAFFFISEMSGRPGEETREWPTPRMEVFPLRTDKFKFEFDAWLPGRESREAYEARLRGSFDSSVEKFVGHWGRLLRLDKFEPEGPKAVTRPRDPDFDSLKWLIAWNEGATHLQIAECFNTTVDAVKKGIGTLKAFSLPIRTGIPGQRKPAISDERVRQIRSIK